MIVVKELHLFVAKKAPADLFVLPYSDTASDFFILYVRTF